MTRYAALTFLLVSASCVAEVGPAPDVNQLEIDTLDDTTIAGSFVHGSSVIVFRAESADQKLATLALDVNGAELEVELDLANERYTEDGHLNTLYADDLAALLALRDELQAEYPDLVLSTLQGKLLARHADRLAEAPVGLTMPQKFVDIASARKVKQLVNRADADGCGGDGATCLRGTNGWDYAVYDPGDNGTCVWKWAQYGEDERNCSGRCGAGCNHWFDDDYTWDCFDHDRCIDAYGGSTTTGNSNCTDEFWDAADDYAVTYGPWC